MSEYILCGMPTVYKTPSTYIVVPEGWQGSHNDRESPAQGSSTGTESLELAPSSGSGRILKAKRK